MKFLMAVLLSFASSAANAVTIDFEALLAGSAGTSIVVGDYQFTSAGNFLVSASSGSKAVVGPNPFNPFASPVLTLSRTDGGLFDLVSLEVFAADSNGLGVPIGFRAFDAFNVATLFQAQTPAFGNGALIPSTRTSITFPTAFQNVAKVTWQNGAFFHQFDNLIVNSSLTTAVPEPDAWMMLIAGFSIVGLAARRKRPATTI